MLIDLGRPWCGDRVSCGLVWLQAIRIKKSWILDSWVLLRGLIAVFCYKPTKSFENVSFGFLWDASWEKVLTVCSVSCLSWNRILTWILRWFALPDALNQNIFYYLAVLTSNNNSDSENKTNLSVEKLFLKKQMHKWVKARQVVWTSSLVSHLFIIIINFNLSDASWW